MAQKNIYAVRYWEQSLAGSVGWSYEVHDRRRRLIGCGWSRGRRRDAERDVDGLIAKLQGRS